MLSLAGIKERGSSMSKPTLLITAFDPFGGEKQNASEACLQKLPDKLRSAHSERLFRLKKTVLPTAYKAASESLLKLFSEAEEPYAAIIHLGQAGGAAAVRLERIAVNLDDAALPDNAGETAEDRIIRENGPAAYFSTLPVKKMRDSLLKAGIPAVVSNSAGTFLCNHVMYESLYYCARHEAWSTAPSGFVHLPLLPEQAARQKQEASMAADLSARAVEILISRSDL